MAKQKNIPKRSEVEKQYTWALEDIFATDELWEKALDECRTFPEKIEAFRGRLAESADMLYSYLTFCDELDVKITRVAEYIMRKSDEDTGNSYYNGLKGRFMSVYINIAGASSFDTPEILAIPDEKLAAFMNEKPELRPVSYTHLTLPTSLDSMSANLQKSAARKTIFFPMPKKSCLLPQEKWQMHPKKSHRRSAMRTSVSRAFTMPTATS